LIDLIHWLAGGVFGMWTRVRDIWAVHVSFGSTATRSGTTNLLVIRLLWYLQPLC